MLVGLAVDDIKAVQDTAVLQRQALKIKLALESIYRGFIKYNSSAIIFVSAPKKLRFS